VLGSSYHEPCWYDDPHTQWDRQKKLADANQRLDAIQEHVGEAAGELRGHWVVVRETGSKNCATLWG